jgi:hypothetical protein
MEKQNHDTLIIGGVLLIGGYFLVIKPILEKTGLKADPKVEKTEATNQKRLNDWVDTAVKKQVPTKSEQEWKIIADQIYEDLKYTALDDNKADATYQLCRVKNDTDIALLIKLFAKRQEYAFGVLKLGSLKNLVQFVISNLSKKQLATVNDNYRRGNIKFRF